MLIIFFFYNNNYYCARINCDSKINFSWLQWFPIENYDPRPYTFWRYFTSIIYEPANSREGRPTRRRVMLQVMHPDRIMGSWVTRKNSNDFTLPPPKIWECYSQQMACISGFSAIATRLRYSHDYYYSDFSIYLSMMKCSDLSGYIFVIFRTL